MTSGGGDGDVGGDDGGGGSGCSGDGGDAGGGVVMDYNCSLMLSS